MTRRRDTAFGRVWRSLSVPLACYWGLTVVVPLLHGAARSPGFWRHATFVLLLSLLVAGLLGFLWVKAKRARSVPTLRDLK